MNRPQRGFIIDVDEAIAGMDEARLMDFLGWLGIDTSDMKQSGKELRLSCQLNCGKACETSSRVLAIQGESRGKIWACHDYNCPIKGGNLVKLIDLAIPGSDPLAKVSGERFKEVARLLKSYLEGETVNATPPKSAGEPEQRPATIESKPALVPANVPLAEHEKESVRKIADLHEKLTMDRSQMTPEASAYVAKRPYLTAELADERHFGYLSASNRGTLRGMFVYALNNRSGQPVAYFGRNLKWEKEHATWEKSGREGDAPAKYRFPAAPFHRGVELYGQEYLTADRVGQTLRENGLPVVEGAGDVLNLAATLRIRAVGILSNRMAEHQYARIVELARQVAGGVVTLFYDNDEPGNQGAAADAAELSKYCRVQRAWSLETHPQFAGMQPEQLSAEQGAELREHLTRSRRR